MSTTTSFTRTFLRLFVPAATQGLFFSLLGLLDMLMVGQLGDAPVAAVGMAGQFFFLLSLTLFGTAGGAGMFAAQYWGARDLANLRRVLGLCLAVGVSTAALFAIVALAAPGWIIGFYTHDAHVAELGVSYLRIIGWSYIFTAVTVAFAAMLRSTGDTRLPMLVAVSFLSLNTLLDYSLIFGKFGLPEMGVRGAAAGTAIARILECLTLLLILYTRRSAVAGTLKQLFQFDLPFITHHLRLIFLVFVNEFAWALGVNVYNAIIAQQGTSIYAAYSVTTTIVGFALFFSMGCATTSGILVGHAIGAGEIEKAYRTGGRILKVSAAGSFFLGLLLALARIPLMDLYQVSAQARSDAEVMILVAGLTLTLRSLDAIFIVGILRSGGDTRFSALIDVGGIWLAGIPFLALMVFVFHAPAQWIYLSILSESLVKSYLGLRRYLSRRWIRNITAPLVPSLTKE